MQSSAWTKHRLSRKVDLASLRRQTLIQKLSLTVECRERAGKAMTELTITGHKEVSSCSFPTQELVPLPPSGTQNHTRRDS